MNGNIVRGPVLFCAVVFFAPHHPKSALAPQNTTRVVPVGGLRAADRHAAGSKGGAHPSGCPLTCMLLPATRCRE